MAGGGIVDSNGGARAHLYEYTITPYFIFACIVGSMGGSLFGYDLGVSGGVTSMDDFLKEFFPKIYRRKQEKLHETDYCRYDNQILTLFTSSLYLAALVSTFGASHAENLNGFHAECLTDTWIGNQRWAFIDLSAGPFSWGPSVGGEGVRTAQSLPNVEKTIGAVAEISEDEAEDRLQEAIQEKFAVFGEVGIF